MKFLALVSLFVVGPCLAQTQDVFIVGSNAITWTVDTEFTPTNVANLMTWTQSIERSAWYGATRVAQENINTQRLVAYLRAELAGADQSWVSYPSTDGGVFGGSPSTNTAAVSAVGMINTLASASQRAGIADATNRTIWKQLDDIRVGVGSIGGADMSSTNAILTLINDALRASNNTEWLDYIATQMVPRMVSVNDNLLTLKNDFRGWEGDTDHARTWAEFAKHVMDPMTETPEAPNPEGMFSSSEQPFKGYSWGVILNHIDDKFHFSRGTMPADRSTAPTWTINVPWPSSSGNLAFTIDGAYWEPMRGPIRMACLLGTTLACLWMVWKSVERKG